MTNPTEALGSKIKEIVMRLRLGHIDEETAEKRIKDLLLEALINENQKYVMGVDGKVVLNRISELQALRSK
jgi:hypothetical protein